MSLARVHFVLGSYFGEAWVLLSNLLSCLQMKVSGGAIQKKKKKKASIAILEWAHYFNKSQNNVFFFPINLRLLILKTLFPYLLFVCVYLQEWLRD